MSGTTVGKESIGGYLIRPATAADAAVIAHHRAAMFRDMGMLADGDGPALQAASHAYLTAALASGTYLGWVVEAQRQVVAGGGVLVRRLLPRPGSLEGGQDAYVLNLYTEPEHRRRGLARHLMQAILAWCRGRRISRISLHASDDGRPLYEALGFAPTNEMRLEVPEDT
jgi:GNAT superfamily N-acetyltransferase